MIDCDGLVKIYASEETEVVALQGLSLKVEPGELMAIIGASGSGKSTLLNMLGGLDRASAGRLLVDGSDLFKMSRAELCAYRRGTVGFVWQNAARNLIPYLNARENVALPMARGGKKARFERADALLDMVGLADRRHHHLQELSGGQQQRIALAISLANGPKLLLADEPTGAVDGENAERILETLRSFNRETGLTIVIVTHDMDISKRVDRIVSIRDGQVSSEFHRAGHYEDFSSFKGLLDEEEHIESVVVDRVGRIQLPKDYFEGLKASGSGHLIAEIDGDSIRFSPAKRRQGKGRG